MKTSKAEKIRITKRDLEILKYLAKVGVLSPALIKGNFFSNGNHKNHYRVMYRLEKERLVAVIARENKQLVFGLTPKGKRFLLGAGVSVGRDILFEKSYATSLQHDLILAEIQRIFESSSVVCNFENEFVVRHRLAHRHGKQGQFSNRYKIPDGTFILKRPGRELKVALELEITRKSKRRWRNILKQYLLGKDADAVLFIVRESAWNSLLKSLIHDLKENDFEVKFANSIPSFYFVTLEEFRMKQRSARFEGDNRCFTLNQLEEEMLTYSGDKPQTEVITKLSLRNLIPNSKSALTY